MTIKIGGACIKDSKEQSLLGRTLDQSFSLKTHVKALCRKVSQKLHVLASISCYMATEKLKQVMRAFILSQFNYCPLVCGCLSVNCRRKILSKTVIFLSVARGYPVLFYFQLVQLLYTCSLVGVFCSYHCLMLYLLRCYGR